MGTNGPTFDKEHYYANKTTNQLSAELKKFEDAVRGWDNSLIPFPPAFYNEHIHYLKMKIAERIINKNLKA